MRPLTATSYAVLGLLAVRARSGYELVGHIKRSNIRLIWPRAGASLPLVQELAGVGPRFPERAHVIAVADRFLVDVLQTTLRWSEWAEGVVEQWSGTKQDRAMAAQARKVLAENATAVEAIAAQPPRGSQDA